MAGTNLVILIGRLGADPEMRFTQSKMAVCNFSLATTEQWTKNGEKQEKTEWHRIVAWGKSAEICGEYLSKGSLVYVEGKLQTSTWEDKDGGGTRYKTEIVLRNVQFLDNRTTKETSKHDPQDSYIARQEPQPQTALDEDIPF